MISTACVVQRHGRVGIPPVVVGGTIDASNCVNSGLYLAGCSHEMIVMVVGLMTSCRQILEADVVGASYYYVVVVVVLLLLLGLSCHFCRLLGCRMPTPSVVFIDFLSFIRVVWVPRIRFFPRSLVRRFSPGYVPRHLHLNRVSTGIGCNLLGTEKKSICTLFLDVRSLYSFFVGSLRAR